MCNCCCCDPVGTNPPVSSVLHVGGSVSEAYNQSCSEPLGVNDGDLMLASVVLFGDVAYTADLSGSGFSLVSRIADTWAAKAIVCELWSKTRTGADGPYTPAVTPGATFGMAIDAFRNWASFSHEASYSDQIGVDSGFFSGLLFPVGSYAYAGLGTWNGNEEISGPLELSQFLEPYGDLQSWVTNNMKTLTGPILLIPPGDAYDTFAGHIAVITPA